MASTELVELGEETDEYTQTTSKLRDLIKGLTGFDIMVDDENFKDIYEIILGIGKEWDNLTDVEQASLGEALAGKRNANALYAVIGNLDTLEAAYESASNSAGSAAKEQENYSKSIQYSLDRLTASYEVLAADLLSSDFAKGIVEFLVSVVELLDGVVEHVGVLIPLLTTIGGLAIFKNLNNIKALSDLGKSLNTIASVTETVSTLQSAGTVSTKLLADAVSGLTAQEAASVLASNGVSEAMIAETIALKGVGTETAEQIARSATLTASQTVQKKTTFSLSSAYKGLASSLGLTTTAFTALLGVVAVATVAAVSIYEIAKANEKVAESAQELGAEFANTKSDIESYKEKVDELRDTINNSSDMDEVHDARAELLSIQTEMIEAYGVEAGEVIKLTDTLNDQADAWENLTTQQWNSIKNQFNANDTWNPFDDLNRYFHDASDNIDLMLDEMENASVTIQFDYDDIEIAKEIQSLYGLERGISAPGTYGLELTGSLSEVQDKLLEIQELLESTDGVSDKTLNKLTANANALSETMDAYGEFFSQYVYYERILKNDNYKNYLEEVTKAYEQYEEAYAENDEAAQQAAIKEIANLKNSILSAMMDDETLDSAEQSVLNFVDDLIPLVEDRVSSYQFELNIEANTDYIKDNILEAISKFDRAEDIPSVLSSYTSSTMTEEQKEAWTTLNEYAEDYGMTITEIIELLSKLGMIELSYDPNISKDIRDAASEINNRFVFGDTSDTSLTDRLNQILSNTITNSSVRRELNAFFEEMQIDTEEEYELWIDVASGCDTATEAMQKYRDAVAEVVNESAEAFSFDSISDAVSDMNDRLLPQFEKLGELYDEIFNGDNGFDLSGIDTSDLYSIEEAFSNLNESLEGISPPTDEIKAFLYTIGDSSSTAAEVQSAFNNLATAYFNAAVEAGNFSEENAAVLEQMLTEMGIANASEVVDYYEQVAMARKLAADNGKDLANMTAAEIEQFAQEVGASEETANALYILALKKIFLNENWINEETSVEQVLALAKAAGIATEAVTKLANVQAQISGIKANIANELKSGNPNTTNISSWEAQLAGLEQSAADYAKQIEEDINNVSVDVTFDVPKTSSGGGGSSASKAGKEDGEDYVDAFEEALKKLEEKRDAGLLTEREFLAEYKALIEKFFGTGLESPIAEEDLQAAQEYSDSLDDIYKSYNGINNMDRDFIAWDEDNIKQYSDFVIEQFGSIEEGMKELEGTWSTVMGGVENIDDVKIAFSNLLQTDHGLVPLTSDVLWDYIEEIYRKAIDENGVFDVEKFIQLDKAGSDREIYGQMEHVSNMIAAAEGQMLNGIKITADDVIAIGTPGEDLPEELESIFKGFSMHDIHANTLLKDYSDFLGQMEGQTEEFVKRMHDYFERLTTYYESVFSAIGTILSHRIDALEESKNNAVKAINKEKEAAAESYQAQIDYLDDLIDAKEAEIEALDDEIDRYQDQIDAIDDQIEALEDANEHRKQALDLQKSQIALEQAQNQRTKLVKFANYKRHYISQRARGRLRLR